MMAVAHQHGSVTVCLTLAGMYVTYGHIIAARLGRSHLRDLCMKGDVRAQVKVGGIRLEVGKNLAVVGVRGVSVGHGEIRKGHALFGSIDMEGIVDCFLNTGC
jgi:hypothetical protein